MLVIRCVRRIVTVVMPKDDLTGNKLVISFLCLRCWPNLLILGALELQKQACADLSFPAVVNVSKAVAGNRSGYKWRRILFDCRVTVPFEPLKFQRNIHTFFRCLTSKLTAFIRRCHFYQNIWWTCVTSSLLVR